MYGGLFRNVLFPLYETRLRGRETLTRLRELERSQWRPESEIRELNWRRMLDALHFAEANIPFYRRRFAEYGVRVGDVQDPSDLLRFPVLTRTDLRTSARELIAEGFVDRLYASGSGGSTGEPVRFYYDHRTYEHRMAAAMRSDGWAGARVGDRELHVWGTPMAPETRLQEAKRRVHEAIVQRRMMSAYDLAAARLTHIVDEITRFRPHVVIGYANPLYHVARHALEAGRRLPAPRGVVTTAERLYEHHREAIERAFGAPVFDRYGCREMMLIASECERHAGLHINMENVFVEIVRGGCHAAPGEPGEVVVTDLVSRSMPLVRYQNQDVAVGAAASCPCGRGLPLLAGVEGRVLDMIVGPEGQMVAGEFFPQLLKEHGTVARYQVHQDRSRALTIKLVPGQGFQPETAQRIEATVRRFLGERAVIRMELVDDIPVTRGGKFRFTVSDVPVDLAHGDAA